MRAVSDRRATAQLRRLMAWLEPFKDLGAGTVTLQNTGGTDHLSFDGVGLLNQPQRVSDFSSGVLLSVRGCTLTKKSASRKKEAINNR